MRTLLAAVLCMVLGGPAHSQSSFCGRYEDFVAAIKEKYKEASIGKGITGGGGYVNEVWVSAAGTFTILRTNPASGTTCIIAAGHGWLSEKPQTQGTDL